ncbi:MAG: ion channel, partial [Oceanisphaera sp.]|nr:ion channel [Oceanisphaera sp.]
MFTVFFVNCSLIILVVLIHFETLSWLSTRIPNLLIRHRTRVLLALLGAMLAHVAEIWLFALGYFGLLNFGDYGSLHGFRGPIELLDCAYFSFTTYTSLGFGDIYPLGPIRFLAGLEALTGLMLITWTASFL